MHEPICHIELVAVNFTDICWLTNFIFFHFFSAEGTDFPLDTIPWGQTPSIFSILQGQFHKVTYSLHFQEKLNNMDILLVFILPNQSSAFDSVGHNQPPMSRH